MKLQIYTAYHATAPLLASPSVTPMHVGRTLAANPLADMIGDDTGTSISERNPEFCELTALYWAWKNDQDSTHLGLMHYRRVLDFDGSFADTEVESLPGRFDIPDWLDSAENWVASSLGDYDIVVPKKHRMGQSVSKNYIRRHAPEDWDITRQIIARDHPDYLPAFDTVAEGFDIRLGNMMVMHRALFERYCAWLFDILFKLEAWDLDRSYYDPRQRRYLGFVAERLLTVYIHHLQTEQPDLRVREVNIVNIRDALTCPYLADQSLNGPEHVNIAFSADRAYMPHTAAMLQSMLERANPDRQLNLFFLHSGVPSMARSLLAEVIGNFPNATLHEMNAGRTFDGSYRSPSRAPSNATYNRFLLFDLLPSLDRLLYVDVDMIFRGDVCDIFDTPMGEARLAAVPDYIMTRVLTGPTPTADPDVPDLYDYYSTRLGMSDEQISRYFNAGLLLFNFAAIDVEKTSKTMMEMAQTGRYLFRDQDILNVYFKDESMRLDDRYNVFNTINDGYNRVPAKNHAAAMAAHKDPIVIHYAAGDYKPWKRAVPLGQYYWEALAKTPFYQEVLAMQGRRRNPAASAPKHDTRQHLIETGRALAERAPRLRPALLKVYRAMQRVSG